MKLSKFSLTTLRKVLAESQFNPAEPGPMQVIVTGTNPLYLIQRSGELLRTAQNQKGKALHDSLRMAISLLAAARAMEGGTDESVARVKTVLDKHSKLLRDREKAGSGLVRTMIQCPGCGGTAPYTEHGRIGNHGVTPGECEATGQDYSRLLEKKGELEGKAECLQCQAIVPLLKSDRTFITHRMKYDTNLCPNSRGIPSQRLQATCPVCTQATWISDGKLIEHTIGGVTCAGSGGAVTKA